MTGQNRKRHRPAFFAQDKSAITTVSDISHHRFVFSMNYMNQALRFTVGMVKGKRRIVPDNWIDLRRQRSVVRGSCNNDTLSSDKAGRLSISAAPVVSLIRSSVPGALKLPHRAITSAPSLAIVANGAIKNAEVAVHHRVFFDPVHAPQFVLIGIPSRGLTVTTVKQVAWYLREPP